MTAQRYDRDILQSPVLPLMAVFPGAFFNSTLFTYTQQGLHRTASTTFPLFPSLLDSQICHRSSISSIIKSGKVGSLRIESN
ncbi:hypothetical protein TNCV_1198011 [Trichonephila clavipes]|uniref:Uncharacterized protein n=1 Tax=Trichonephila clavipes TaxID=2585209 RepID=A0A8X6SBL2_TRICX|nr:hypothetical protein TNCV_1198011 [Trichonephila clavipes]